jgi:hypothetical protein
MHWTIQGVDVQTSAPIHHLADVETIESEQRSLLYHISPVSKLREEFLVRLVDTRILPNGHAVLFKQFAGLFLQGF